MLFVFNKTKQQQSLNNSLYSLLYISTQIHTNTPNSLWKKAQCRNPKQVSKKVATLEKTTVLYRSNSLISLMLYVHRVKTNNTQRGKVLLSSLFKVGIFCWPLLALDIACAHERTYKRGKYFYRFVFVCFSLSYKLHEQTKFNDLSKNTNFLQSSKSPYTFHSKKSLVNI